MPLNRRDFIATALAGAAIAAAPRLAHSQTKRPNILFILADDLGYGDLSCYGRPDYQTPNLDRLAAQGVRFQNAYSAAPLCTPTRCAFITGRYPARTLVGLEEPLTERSDLGERAKVLGLPAEHSTIASLLKQSGYQTALIGKWHLGYLPNFGPVQSGFEEFFGIMSGAADFFTHKDMSGDGDLYEGKVSVERIGYMTEMLTQRAVKYISDRRNSPTPFYLSLHYTAPHWPWEGPNDEAVSRNLKGGYGGFTAGGSLKTYAQMMKSLDDGIGEVLRALDRAGLAGNTLVIFTSDNGGERFSYNWPFRGAKFSLWEGGIRVPAIVRLPGMSKVQRPMSNVTYDMSNVQGPMSNVSMLGSYGVKSVPGAIATGSQVVYNVQDPMSNVSMLGSYGVKSVPGAVATGSQVMSKVQGPMSNVGADDVYNVSLLGSEASDGVKSVPGAVATGSPIDNRQLAIANSPGRIIHDVAITMDWTATILAAAGVKPDPNYPLDGINLLPTIRDTQPSPKPDSPDLRHLPRQRLPALTRQQPTPDTRYLFWRTSLQDAALHGRWKYVRDGEQEYLFDLLVDEREQANFREMDPPTFTRLRDEFKKWEATVLPRPPARRRT